MFTLLKNQLQSMTTSDSEEAVGVMHGGNITLRVRNPLLTGSAPKYLWGIA